LRTINHLERVDDGFIDIDGELIGYRRDGDVLHELKERDVLKRRTAVGMVFQTFNLFPHLTVLENLVEAPVAVAGVTREAAERTARTLLARVGLADNVLFMERGRVVESGPPAVVLDAPAHPRTRAFLARVL